MSALVFWLCLVVAAYAYAGYALIAAVLARRRGSTPSHAAITPPLTVVITAYNEAQCIARRVRNLLEQDYPHPRIDLLPQGCYMTNQCLQTTRGCHFECEFCSVSPFNGKSSSVALMLPQAPESPR